jgi:hypothetical protein
MKNPEVTNFKTKNPEFSVKPENFPSLIVLMPKEHACGQF